jgi:hypothetical protein
MRTPTWPRGRGSGPPCARAGRPPFSKGKKSRRPRRRHSPPHRYHAETVSPWSGSVFVSLAAGVASRAPRDLTIQGGQVPGPPARKGGGVAPRSLGTRNRGCLKRSHRVPVLYQCRPTLANTRQIEEVPDQAENAGHMGGYGLVSVGECRREADLKSSARKGLRVRVPPPPASSISTSP